MEESYKQWPNKFRKLHIRSEAGMQNSSYALVVGYVMLLNMNDSKEGASTITIIQHAEYCYGGKTKVNKGEPAIKYAHKTQQNIFMSSEWEEIGKWKNTQIK